MIWSTINKLIDGERLIHSAKAAIACMLGILLVHVVGITADQWVVITIIVVMCAQIYVGSVRQKAYLRFLGTFVGCLFATITLAGFGVTSYSILISIGLSVFIFSYIATGKSNLTYACTLGAVTTTIIMLAQQPTYMLAVQRLLEISAGIFIAAIVSQFILPIHASAHLRRAQAKTLEQLRDYYQISMLSTQSNDQLPDYQELDESIVKTLLKQRELAKESVIEPLSSGFNVEHFMQSLYCERDMLRAVTFMHHAFSHFKNSEIDLDSPFHLAIIQALNNMINVFSSRKYLEITIHLPTVNDLKMELQKKIVEPTKIQLFYIDGLLFSSEILLTSLEKLARLSDIPINQHILSSS